MNMASPPPRYDEEAGPSIVAEVKGSEIRPPQMLDGTPMAREMDAADTQLHELPGSEVPTKSYPTEKAPLSDGGLSPSFRHVSPISGSMSMNEDQSVSALASPGPRSIMSETEKSVSDPSEKSEISSDSPVMRNAFSPVLSPPTEQDELHEEPTTRPAQTERPVVARRSWIANILRRDRERRDNNESKPDGTPF
jgi:hypothetical protein